MQVWQELLIEVLVGLAIYMIGIRSLREVLHGALRRRWGPVAIQLMVFLLLLAVVAFFTLSALASFKVIAGVLVCSDSRWVTSSSCFTTCQRSSNGDGLAFWRRGQRYRLFFELCSRHVSASLMKD